MTIPTIKKDTPYPDNTIREGCIVLIDKPMDWTSFDVCKKIRGVTKVKKVGHGGTLDPFATGLLIVAIGKGTKQLATISQSDKTYRATITFGQASDSYDRTGNITQQGPWAGLTLDKIRTALNKMSGVIEQVPPMFSAKKVNGKRLYSLARKGITIERKPVKVTISKVDVLHWEAPELELMLNVSKGTYIRSYAHDLGRTLKVPALLSELRRVRVGNFSVDDSMDLDGFERFWNKLVG